MSYIQYPGASSRGDRPQGIRAEDTYNPTYKKLIRTIICGVLFGLPMCVAIPNSPLLKLSQTQDNKKMLIPRMMSDFFYVNFIAAAASYWCFVEPFIPNPKGREGFMPYLGPVTAEIPALGCLITSHLFYPGMWAVFNELTWPVRRREFVRLNIKCFFAYANVHIPVVAAIGFGVGCSLYPFKASKQWSWAKDRKRLAAENAARDDL